MPALLTHAWPITSRPHFRCHDRLVELASAVKFAKRVLGMQRQLLGVVLEPESKAGIAIMSIVVATDKVAVVAAKVEVVAG